MARALVVGCGCRGRELGIRLLDAEWQVRGTTRRAEGIAAIETAGIEAAVADPDRIGTIVDLVGDVAVVAWLLGSASGHPDQVEALHGPRLERLCEEIVDTPVRGLIYEAVGTVPAELLSEGRRICSDASQRWHIPVAVLEHDPADPGGWSAAAQSAVLGVVGG